MMSDMEHVGGGDWMVYQNIVAGRFVDRPNRFVAHVEINGVVETVHVKNTGRCRELLIPGVSVMLEKSNNLSRKTGFSTVTFTLTTNSPSRVTIRDRLRRSPSRNSIRFSKTNRPSNPIGS